MSQLREWLQDDWMRDFLGMMTLWIVVLAVASLSLVLFGAAIY